MNVEITDQERDFLSELFEEKQKHMIQEINHTDTIDFERNVVCVRCPTEHRLNTRPIQKAK